MKRYIPFIFICLLVSFNLAQQSAYEVVHLTSICRHGARTPIRNSLKLDMVNTLGKAVLTGNGIRQHFILGSKLRAAYPSIFSQYDPSKFDIYVSSVPRTIQSAQSQAAGLFPFGTGHNMTVPDDSKYSQPPFKGAEFTFKNESTLPHSFRPINYIMKTQSIDLYFFSEFQKVCPSAFIFREKAAHKAAEGLSEWTKSVSQELKGSGLSPKEIFGQDDFTFDNIGWLGDELKAFNNYYGKLYGSLSKELSEKVDRLGSLRFAFEHLEEKINRLIADNIARQIVQTIESVVDGTETKKNFLMFSGHDTTIFSQILLFNLSSISCITDWAQYKPVPASCLTPPDYASTLIYEINKKGGSYYIRTLYNNKPVEICASNNDDYYCKASEFVKTVESKLYYKWSDKGNFCGNPYYITDREITKKEFLTLVLIGGGFGIAFLVLLGVYIAMLIKSKKENVLEAPQTPLDYRKALNMDDSSPTKL